MGILVTTVSNFSPLSKLTLGCDEQVVWACTRNPGDPGVPGNPGVQAPTNRSWGPVHETLASNDTSRETQNTGEGDGRNRPLVTPKLGKKINKKTKALAAPSTVLDSGVHALLI